jgi:hypothetical protein
VYSFLWQKDYKIQLINLIASRPKQAVSYI